MWFGILTPGEHECRPVAAPGVATLYCWNDIARMRIDGPAADLASGLRMLRGTMRRRDQEPHDPRCFVCGTEYPIPDPEQARAAAEDWRPPETDQRPDDTRLSRANHPGKAMFALVHLDDDIRDVRDEEALVVVPVARLALLAPLDAIGPMLELFGIAFSDVDGERCPCCDALAPAGARPGAAMTRTERRMVAGGGRVGLGHARPAPRNRRRGRTR